MTAPLIYLIAGEPSGDLLGVRLMQALRRKTAGNVRFAGVGGTKMTGEGLESLFPMSDITLLGAAELLPHLRLIFRRIRETAEDIAAKKPAIVVTIDSPGFNFRVAERLRKLPAPHPPLVHYVAPTVWAYKPERVHWIKRLYDHLLVLLPFEPPYFEKVGLASSFVGHPVVEEWQDKGDGAAFRQRYGIPAEAPLLCLLPGSRKGEIKRHLPLYRDTVERLRERHPSLQLVMPVGRHLRPMVEALLRDWPTPPLLADSENEKKDAFAASDAALAKSGTVTLETALAGLPTIMTYKVNPITAWIVKRTLLIKHFTLVNILAGKEIIPEFVQENATPERLATALDTLLENPLARETQIAAVKETVKPLYADGSPSDKAAEILLGLLE